MAAVSAVLASAFTLPSSAPRYGAAAAPRASIHLAAKLVTNNLAASTEDSALLPAGPLGDFLESPVSDVPLLAAVSIEGPKDGVYECELPPITFFKLGITPLFTMEINREPCKASVRVLRGRCRVGEKLSRTITIGALNTLQWSETSSGEWRIETSTSLELAVKQAPMNTFALKAWQVAGTAIVKGACEANARELLGKIRTAYLEYKAAARAEQAAAEMVEEVAAAEDVETAVETAVATAVETASTAQVAEADATAAVVSTFETAIEVDEGVVDAGMAVAALASEATIAPNDTAAEEESVPLKPLEVSMAPESEPEVPMVPAPEVTAVPAPEVTMVPPPDDKRWRKRRLLFGENVRRFIIFGERLHA